MPQSYPKASTEQFELSHTMKLIIFYLGCSVQLVFSQSIINNYFNIPKFEMGMCPMIRTVPDFDRERYYGVWYSQMQVPSSFQPEDMSCVRAFYRPREDGSVSVYNTGTDSNGVLIEICGKAWQDDKENPGSWKLRQVIVTNLIVLVGN